MIAYAEEKRAMMESSQHHRFVSVSYKSIKEEIYFENLPLMSLILKRVYHEYKEGAVFSLWKMKCNDEKVECVLEFSDDRDWVEIIKSYESSIEVRDASVSTADSSVLLDL